MRRRDVLKTVGLAAGTVGGAGCTRTIAEDTPTPGSPTGTPTGTPTPAEETVPVEIVDVSGFGGSYPVRFDVELEAAAFAGTPAGLGQGAHPAIVRITLTNTGDEERSLRTGHREVFSTTRSDDATYTLVDHERRVGSDVLEGTCWKLEEHLAYPSVMRETELPAGGSRSLTLAVLTHPDTEGCLPAGETAFTETYSAHAVGGEDDGDRLPVGFTLWIGER